MRNDVKAEPLNEEDLDYGPESKDFEEKMKAAFAENAQKMAPESEAEEISIPEDQEETDYSEATELI